MTATVVLLVVAAMALALLVVRAAVGVDRVMLRYWPGYRGKRIGQYPRDWPYRLTDAMAKTGKRAIAAHARDIPDR
jgi:hypothetical protein